MQWIERQRCFLDFTLGSLWRRRGKNLLLIAVYSFIVFLVASVLFFTQALRHQAETILQDAPEMIVQRIIAGRHELTPVRYAEEIRKIRGVRSVKPRLWGYYYHPAALSNYTIMVPDDFPYQDNVVTIGDEVLRTWGTTTDEGLFFKCFDGNIITVQVAGTFDATTSLVTADLILVSDALFRQLFGVPADSATDLAVTVRNKNEESTIAKKILLQFPDTRIVLREEILRTYGALFDWRSGYIIVLLSGALFAFAIFAWDKATGLSGQEKVEVGILKALGWDTFHIIAMKFWEGVAVSLTAFIVGIIGAYLHVFLASAPLFEHALKGWAVVYPNFQLDPQVNVYTVTTLFFLTVLPYTLLTIVPVWRTAVTDPDTVMRQA